MPNSAWGIDLGNRALKAVKLVRENGQIRIDDFDVIEHEQTLSVAGDNKESLVQSALAQFAQRHVTKGSAVGVGVSGQQSFARFIKLPPVEPKRIPEIVRFEAIQQIPFPLDDVEWAYQLFHQKDSPDVEVGIFAMKKDLVNRQISYFTGLGINVEVVQMNPLAIYNAMAFDERVSECTMFIDMGAENTDLVIADGATVWLRTLPIGGSAFTETLGKMFKLTFSKAEELKRNAATSKYAKQIFQAMRPVFADLVADIQRSIGFYSTVHRDSRIQKIVVLGSTFQLPGLQKYLQQNLQLPIEKFDGFMVDKPAEAKTAAALAEHAVTLAGAYGLALQALGESTITSSLLPESIKREKMWKAKTKWFAAAAALVLLGTATAGGMGYYHNFQYDQAGAARGEIQSTLSRADGLIKQWQRDVENKGEDDRVKLTQLQSLNGYRDTWINISRTILSAPPPVDMKKLAAEKRPDRQVIFIDRIQSVYRPDLKTELDATQDDFRDIADNIKTLADAPAATYRAAPQAGRAAGYPGGRAARYSPRGGYSPAPMMSQPGADQNTPKKRGFIVLVECHTPNQSLPFIDKSFVQVLRAIDDKEALKLGQNWYIARAQIVSVGPRVVVDPALLNNPGGVRANLGGRAGRGYVPPVRGAGGNEPSINIPANDPDLQVDLAAGLGLDNAGAYRRVNYDNRMNARRGMLNPTGRADNPDEAEDATPKILFPDPSFPGESYQNDRAFKVLALIVMDPAPKEKTGDGTGTEE